MQTAIASSRNTAPVKTTAPTMKGIGFANIRQYAEQRHSGEAYRRVLDGMSLADRATLSSVVATGWYEVALFGRLLRAIDGTLGSGNGALYPEMGAFEAEQDFNRVLRVFLRVLTPSSILRAEKHIWRHFQSAGHWESQPFEGGIRSTLAGWAVDEALCSEVLGYVARVVRFTGGQHIRTAHPQCTARGHAACVFILQWT